MKAQPTPAPLTAEESDNASQQRTHWNNLSSRWAYLGPPLKPTQQDIDTILETVVHHRSLTPEGLYRVILWGVTPELALMEWPEGAEILAIDRSELMIESVWPGDLPGRRRAVRGEWADTLAVSGGGCDLLIGDGCLGTSCYPLEYVELTEAARDSLRPGALFVMRLHAHPEEKETVAQLVDDLLNRRIGSFDAFKLRLWMAVQESPEAGVQLGDVWDQWNALGIDEADLACLTGWDPRVIATIKLYRGNNTRYFFPTLNQHLRIFQEKLDVQKIHIPEYEMGERRPIVILTRKR